MKFFAAKFSARPVFTAGFAALICIPVLASCATDEEIAERRKPVPPGAGETSKIPWNQARPGEGMGQMGMMMQQNQYRR